MDHDRINEQEGRMDEAHFLSAGQKVVWQQ